MSEHKKLKGSLFIKICLLLTLGGTLHASEANTTDKQVEKVVTSSEARITDDQVKKLVTNTAADIAKDAQDTFRKITDAFSPYKDALNPALYVFVYDENINIVAHPERKKVGECYKGKTDVNGKKFRDEIVSNALSEKNLKGDGWVDYSYTMPGSPGIFQKKTYFQRIKGSDGKIYIVCSGNYSK